MIKFSKPKKMISIIQIGLQRAIISRLRKVRSFLLMMNCPTKDTFGIIIATIVTYREDRINVELLQPRKLERNQNSSEINSRNIAVKSFFLLFDSFYFSFGSFAATFRRFLRHTKTNA